MAKRITSITLALIMLFGVFIVPSVSALTDIEDVTLKVGEKHNVQIGDGYGNIIPVTWTSTDPSVAYVDSTYNIVALKPGKCVITAVLDDWTYIENVTVTGSSSTQPSGQNQTNSSKTSAYTKLANYLENNGTKTTAYGSTDYVINWKEDGYLLWSNYRLNEDVNVAITIPKANSADIYSDYVEGVYLNLMKSGKRKVQYSKQLNTWTGYTKEYKKGTTVNTAKLKLKYSFGPKYSKANSRARKLSKAGMSLWNKFLKKRVGITVKKLGFVYKTGSSAKKISLNKKSATLKKGKTLKLKLKNAKSSKVKWSSSKKKVATVSKKGVVKAKKKGKATITAKYKGKKYKCKITVKAAKKKTNAFAKIRNYIKKNGKKQYNEGYYIYFIGFGNYSSLSFTSKDKGKSLYFDTVADDYEISMDVKTDKTAKAYYMDDEYDYEVTFNISTYTLNTNLSFVSAAGASSSKHIEKANQALKKIIPTWNKTLKSKTGVTLKQLGFKKLK